LHYLEETKPQNLFNFKNQLDFQDFLNLKLGIYCDEIIHVKYIHVFKLQFAPVIIANKRVIFLFIYLLKKYTCIDKHKQLRVVLRSVEG